MFLLNSEHQYEIGTLNLPRKVKQLGSKLRTQIRNKSRLSNSDRIICHSGGFGRNLEEILPTSLTELPIQLRDLRNNLKSAKAFFIVSIHNKQQSMYIPLYAQTLILVNLIGVNFFRFFNFTRNGLVRV